MKSTKSVKLKKYGSVYNQYIKAISAKPAPKPSPKASAKPAPKPSVKPSPKASAKPSPKASPKPSPKASLKPAPKPSTKPSPKASARAVEGPVKNSKKTLNEYQKFMRDESAKDRYKNMKGTDRMIIISKEWEKKKRKCKK
jgi:hypothetical protein